MTDEVRRRHYEHCYRAAAGAGGDDTRRNRMRTMLDSVRQALLWADDQDDRGLLLRLASRMALFWATGPMAAEGADWLRRAIDRGPDVDPALRARAMSRLVQLYLVTGQRRHVGDTAEEAIRLARQLANGRDLAWTLCNVAGYLPRPRPLEMLDEAIDLARAGADRHAEALALFMQSFELVSFYSAPRGVAVAAQAAAAARACGFGHVERLADAVVAIGPVFSGREVASVVEPGRRALAALEQAGDDNLRAQLLGALTSATLLAGDRSQAERDIEELERASSSRGGGGTLVYAGGAAQLSRGLMHLLWGEWADAADAFEAVRFSNSALSPRAAQGLAATAALLDGNVEIARDRVRNFNAEDDSRWTGVAESAAAATALAGGDREAVDLAYDAFTLTFRTSENRAPRAIRPLGSITDGQAALVLGGVVAASGGHEDAARIFGWVDAHARARGVAFDLPYFAAIALGGPAKARAALGQARYEELFAEGAALDEEAFVSYVLRGRGPRRRPASGWGSLTPTERQVVELVADGLSNQQIADKLFMSLATVKSHLTHVYNKLGLSSRAALSAAAVLRRT